MALEPSAPASGHYDVTALIGEGGILLVNPLTWYRPLVCAASLVACLALGPLAQVAFEPARLRSGVPPAPPSPHIVGWGQEWLRVSVDTTGDVSAIEPLREVAFVQRSTAGGAIHAWTFAPARADGEPVASEVLVAALFRPATAYGRPAVSQPLSSRARASAQVPIPVSTPSPAYPPRAIGSGGIVIEVAVDRKGKVVGATRMASSGSGFDNVAVGAARRWRFQPATRGGHPVASVAYLVFSFREPVVVAPVSR